MAETYSVATLARSARHEPAVPQTLTLPDTAARQGNFARSMMLGSQVLCKRADGSLGWYTFDAERSTPTDPIMNSVG